MGKVAFIMDKSSCCGMREMSGIGVCRKWNRKDLSTFPEDCPLRDIQKTSVGIEVCIGNKTESIQSYVDGYNACVDEILKERD